MLAITYFRVSTARQGQSGLGLEAQRAAVAAYCQGRCEIADEYVEVESGKNNARPQLAAAIAQAKALGAKLIIAKLDRLSRNAAFIMELRDSGVDFVAADMPEANTLTIGLMAVMAQDERERISARTKAALQAKKAQGATLGKPENMTHEAQVKGAKARHDKAADGYRKISGYVKLLRNSGLSYAKIAETLNSEGHTTPTGKRFAAMQVKRIMEY